MEAPLELAKQALSQISLVPLYGGGFWVAFTQLVVFYYTVGAILHSVLPRVIPVHGIQQQQRKKGEVLRDAFYSIGESCQMASVVSLAFWQPSWGLARGPWTPRAAAVRGVRTQVPYSPAA
jgi:hypothetical protein